MDDPVEVGKGPEVSTDTKGGKHKFVAVANVALEFGNAVLASLQRTVLLI